MRWTAVVAAVAAATLAGCQQRDAVEVSDAWVRLAAAPGRPAAGYFRVRGGRADASLIEVGSSAAGRIELHETMPMTGQMGGGQMMAMRPIAAVPVPAGGQVAFAPGGRHLMLFDVASGIRAGGVIPLTFRFADGATQRVAARVIAAGDAAPE